MPTKNKLNVEIDFAAKNFFKDLFLECNNALMRKLALNVEVLSDKRLFTITVCIVGRTRLTYCRVNSRV